MKTARKDMLYCTPFVQPFVIFSRIYLAKFITPHHCQPSCICILILLSEHTDHATAWPYFLYTNDIKLFELTKEPRPHNYNM